MIFFKEKNIRIEKDGFFLALDGVKVSWVFFFFSSFFFSFFVKLLYKEKKNVCCTL